MTKITVTLEFDDDDLGPKWMNPDNLNLLLYSKASTRKDLLSVVEYVEHDPRPPKEKGRFEGPMTVEQYAESERKRKCDKCPSPNGCDTCKAQFYPNLLGERKRGGGE